MEHTDSDQKSAHPKFFSWTKWLLDGSLILIAVVGAWFAWPVQSEAGRLNAKRAELQRIVGEMPISDPKKFHVLLLESQNPNELRWRVYVPEKFGSVLFSKHSSASGGSGSSTSSISSTSDPAFESLITVTLQTAEDNSNIQFRTYLRALRSRGYGVTILNDDSIAKMIKVNDTSSWRIAGKNGVEMFSEEELCTLLAIESLNQSAGPNHTSSVQVGVGTQAALNKARL